MRNGDHRGHHHKSYRMNKGKLKINPFLCTGCERCIERCFHGAIDMGIEGKATIDQSKCVGCGHCVNTCSQHAISFPL
jgi:ferredoxin